MPENKISFAPCPCVCYFPDTSLRLAVAAEGLSEGSSIGETVTITMAGEFLYYLNGHVSIVET